MAYVIVSQRAKRFLQSMAWSITGAGWHTKESLPSQQDRPIKLVLWCF